MLYPGRDMRYISTRGRAAPRDFEGVLLAGLAEDGGLFLPEAWPGLSPAESHQMAQLLGTLDPSMTVLIIEHDMDVALEIARQVTVLHYGRVIADGTREEIRAHPLVREIYLGA